MKWFTSQARPERKVHVPLLLATATSLTLALSSAVGLGAQEDAPANNSGDPDWPRSYSVDDDDLVLYQPTVEKWDQNSLLARFAVGIKGRDDSQPIYGSFVARAETTANSETRLVSVYNITAQDFKFPDAAGRLNQIKRDIAAVSPQKPLSIPLDELVASVPSENAVSKDTVVTKTETTAPRIIVSYDPAILVSFDGDPIYRAIAGAGLESAVNTSAIVLRSGDQSTVYVMENNGQWLSSTSLDGPWQESDAPPGLDRIPQSHPVSQAIQEIMGSKQVQSEDSEASRVIVTTTPTELVQLKGKPRYDQIGDTALVRVGNTDAPLFYHFEQRAYYLLLSGRWFRSNELKGPWDYVAQNELPGEFAQIPPDDPSADVLASVAGTEEAEEAAVEAQVPEKAEVSLQDQPELSVDYDGEPQFTEIAGTECAYATNTTYEVLRVRHRYYCCRDGVWFSCERPRGERWRLVTVVPEEVYSLPPSCPLYHVRFCTVDNFDSENVTYSCTAGYRGTYIDPVTHVCVYGTGYHYKPYVSSSFYAGYPLTYGYGSCWLRHKGFVYENRHVVHSAWAPRFVKPEGHTAFWPANAGRWGGHWEKDHWRTPSTSVAPFRTWGKQVATAQAFISNLRPKMERPEGPAPRVVFHHEPSERHMSGFEKGLLPGTQGEILRHSNTGWEKRESGKWVEHPMDPKMERRTIPSHTRTGDMPSRHDTRVLGGMDRTGKRKNNFEIRPAETSTGDRKGHPYTIPPQDSGARDPKMEKRGMHPDDLPSGRKGGVPQSDSLPSNGQWPKNGDSRTTPGERQKQGKGEFPREGREGPNSEHTSSGKIEKRGMPNDQTKGEFPRKGGDTPPNGEHTSSGKIERRGMPNDQTKGEFPRKGGDSLPNGEHTSSGKIERRGMPNDQTKGEFPRKGGETLPNDEHTSSGKIERRGMPNDQTKGEFPRNGGDTLPNGEHTGSGKIERRGMPNDQTKGEFPRKGGDSLPNDEHTSSGKIERRGMPNDQTKGEFPRNGEDSSPNGQRTSSGKIEKREMPNGQSKGEFPRKGEDSLPSGERSGSSKMEKREMPSGQSKGEFPRRGEDGLPSGERSGSSKMEKREMPSGQSKGEFPRKSSDSLPSGERSGSSKMEKREMPSGQSKGEFPRKSSDSLPSGERSGSSKMEKREMPSGQSKGEFPRKSSDSLPSGERSSSSKGEHREMPRGESKTDHSTREMPKSERRETSHDSPKMERRETTHVEPKGETHVERHEVPHGSERREGSTHGESRGTEHSSRSESSRSGSSRPDRGNSSNKDDRRDSRN